jgi:site-specific DNA-methyltransferase (adenine-specific)
MKKISPKKNDNWKTPDYVYDVLNEEFNFDFDPCPYCEEDLMFDGLKIDWGQSNFINPPYSRKLKIEFVKKAIAESKKGKLCVLLIPASTDTKLFHDIILPENRK